MEKLKKLINNTFGSFENFKTEFSKAQELDLVLDGQLACYCSGELKICSTPNQDNPLMEGQWRNSFTLFRCLGTWLYYLNYQNRRPDYIRLL